MTSNNGEVTINDEPTKARLFRFCEKKIDQWLKSRESGGTTGEEAPPRFRVSFNEEDGEIGISCTTEIDLGGQHWLGWDLGEDPQQAFMHSLKRLHPQAPTAALH